MFKPFRQVILILIKGYQLILSPYLPPSCRFTPTCSQYALDAIRERGVLAGGALAARRICRCHPWGACGHDPVPKADGGWRMADGKTVSAHTQFHG